MNKPVFILALTLVLVHLPVRAGTPVNSEQLATIRKEVETLRGNTFKHDVPAVSVSMSEIQAMVNRELDKAFPGKALDGFVEFETWMDLLPPKTDIKALYSRFLMEQAAGMYDTDTRCMYIPTTNSTGSADARKALQEKVGADGGYEGIVLAHEYTHALDHQYWPLDTLTNNMLKDTTDREDAYKYVVEGTATRLMMEAFPAQMAGGSPDTYIPFWRFIHMGAIDAVMNHMLHGYLWDQAPAEMPGIPAAMARQEVLPYGYGYLFCSTMMRDWGLDGLDRAYNHRPVSTKQVMDPRAYWEWRDFPVQVDLLRTLPGGWVRVADDVLGAADTAVIFGSHFKSLAVCERLVRGWKGDHAGFYKSADGHRLLIWGSAWASTRSAEHFAQACVDLRKKAHKASIKRTSGTRVEWTRPDGRAGVVVRNGRNVVLIETDMPTSLTTDWVASVTFSESPDEAIRAAQNNAFLRHNPLLSRQKDDDYALTQSLWGLLWRHDRNDVGRADKVLLGVVESRRTTSFTKWGVGWGLLARHEAEARRGLTQTTVLPWGTLWNHFSAKFPDHPGDTMTRDSCLWGLAGSYTRSAKVGELNLLPFGVLFRYDASPATTSVHVLATGVSRTAATKTKGARTRIRILGIPVFSKVSLSRKEM